MNTAYQRVIPRDLFNEANLLKCLGRLWIVTERYQPHKIVIEHDGNRFDVWQDDDGDIGVHNIHIYIGGNQYRVVRPLNSRRSWPLYLERYPTERYDRIPVFTEFAEGELHEEMLALLGVEHR